MHIAPFIILGVSGVSSYQIQLRKNKNIKNNVVLGTINEASKTAFVPFDESKLFTSFFFMGLIDEQSNIVIRKLDSANRDKLLVEVKRPKVYIAAHIKGPKKVATTHQTRFIIESFTFLSL